MIIIMIMIMIIIIIIIIAIIKIVLLFTRQFLLLLNKEKNQLKHTKKPRKYVSFDSLA